MQVSTALQRLAFDIALASDGGVNRMEKAQAFPQPAIQSHHLYRSYPDSDDRFNGKGKTKSFQAMAGVFHDGLISVRNTQYTITVRALRIEDARQKPFTPIAARSRRPGNNLLDAFYLPSGVRANR